MWKYLLLIIFSFIICACENGTLAVYTNKGEKLEEQDVTDDRQNTFNRGYIKCLNNVAYYAFGHGITVLLDRDGKPLLCEVFIKKDDKKDKKDKKVVIDK